KANPSDYRVLGRGAYHPAMFCNRCPPCCRQGNSRKANMLAKCPNRDVGHRELFLQCSNVRECAQIGSRILAGSPVWQMRANSVPKMRLNREWHPAEK